MMAIKTITLKRWDQIHRYVRPRWLYRGQRSSRWRLETSLERCCKQLKVRPEARRDFENALFREFRRTYHQYSTHLPERAAVVEWLSLMQHHGAPTRLLDASYSIYVAAYFALEDARGDAAVWAVNGEWAVNTAAGLLRAAGKPNVEEMEEPFEDGDEARVEELFFSEPYVGAAWPINPFRLSERLRIQRGAFLIPGDVSRPFMANLRALPGYESPRHLLKIVIPKGLRLTALSRLFAMDISRSSLFPGLDGFARSLGVYHSAFNRKPWVSEPARKAAGAKRRG